MINALCREFGYQQLFPDALGLVLNPLHISRRGLANGVRRFAGQFTGDVLDLDCVSKPYCEVFYRCQFYVDLDIDVNAHNHADSQVDVFYDGKVISFSEARFDGGVAFETLEHVFTLEPILKELHWVLQPEDDLMHVLQAGGFEVVEVDKTNTFVLTGSQLFIEYISKYVAPSSGVLRALFKQLVLFLMTLLACGLNAVLLKPDNYNTNCKGLARRAAH